MRRHLYAVTTLSTILLSIGCAPKKLSPKEVVQKILDDLPAGSTPAKVSNYLDAKDIAHSAYAAETKIPDSILAIARGTPSFLFRTDYQIRFRFTHDMLSSYEIRPVFTGP